MAAETAQALFDAYVSALDHTLREMGVGDLTVPKKMRKLGEAFYGRAKAYETRPRQGRPGRADRPDRADRVRRGAQPGERAGAGWLCSGRASRPWPPSRGASWRRGLGGRRFPNERHRLGLAADRAAGGCGPRPPGQSLSDAPGGRRGRARNHRAVAGCRLPRPAGGRPRGARLVRRRHHRGPLARGGRADVRRQPGAVYSWSWKTKSSPCARCRPAAFTPPIPTRKSLSTSTPTIPPTRAGGRSGCQTLVQASRSPFPLTQRNWAKCWYRWES